jgi:gamma-glutamyltranspeptidase/glutathione hydrolase
MKIQVSELLSDYAAKRRALIDLSRAGEFQAGKSNMLGTVLFNCRYKDGNMVSLIQSNYRGMGSGMVPPQLGFMLQDRGVSTCHRRNHKLILGKDLSILSFRFCN